MRRSAFVMLPLVLLLTACGPDDALRPVISVLSPVEGARVNLNEPFTVYVAAASSHNITRIELHADGVLIGTLNNAPESVTFSANMRFTPQKPGVLQVSATAIDSRGRTSDPTRVQLIVEAPALASINPTATPPAQQAGGPGVPAGCQLNSQFLQDVTVPDNTVIRAGEPFVKVWRLKNTSTCDWGTGYELIFSSGARMNALASAAILPTRRNDSVDVNMAFVAPKDAGSYNSIWQLRAPNGQVFGTRFYVAIKVIE